MSNGLTQKKRAALAVNGPNEMMISAIPRGPRPPKHSYNNRVLKYKRFYNVGKFGIADSRGKNTKSKMKEHKDHREPVTVVIWPRSKGTYVRYEPPGRKYWRQRSKVRAA